MFRRHQDSFPLQGIQFQVFLSLQLPEHLFRIAAAHADRFRFDLREHARDLLLLPPCRVGIDLDLIAFPADPDPSLHGQIVHLDLQKVIGNLQELGRPLQEDFPGQVTAALRQ